MIREDENDVRPGRPRAITLLKRLAMLNAASSLRSSNTEASNIVFWFRITT